MSTIDPQLVQRIADEVMRALQAPRTPSSPPLGLCKGVDTKKESCHCDGACCSKTQSPGRSEGPDTLAKSVDSPRPVTTSLGAAPKHVEPRDTQPVLTGFVTANQLRDAIASSPDGVAVLTAAARLTPLAQDIVRAKPDCVRRRGIPNSTPKLAHVTGGLPWMWWSSGPCDAVAKIVADRRNVLLPSTAARSDEQLTEAIRDLHRAVTEGRAAGGILFVQQGARAMCLANRKRSLRAVLGHCCDAVRAAIGDLGPNVLVLEYPFNDHDRMARCVDLVLNTNLSVPARMKSMLAMVEN